MSVGSWMLSASGTQHGDRRGQRLDGLVPAPGPIRPTGGGAVRPAAVDLHRRAPRQHGRAGLARGARAAAVRVRLRRGAQRGGRRRGRDADGTGGAGPAPRARRGRRAISSLTELMDRRLGRAGRALQAGSSRRGSPRSPRPRSRPARRCCASGVARSRRRRDRGGGAAARRRVEHALERLQGGLSVGGGSEVRGRSPARRDRARRAARRRAEDSDCGWRGRGRSSASLSLSTAALVDTRHEYSHLFGIYVPIAIGVFALFAGAIVVAALVYRRREPARAARWHENNRLEGGYALLLAAGRRVPPVPDLHRRAPRRHGRRPTRRRASTVNVTARQVGVAVPLPGLRLQRPFSGTVGRAAARRPGRGGDPLHARPPPT